MLLVPIPAAKGWSSEASLYVRSRTIPSRLIVMISRPGCPPPYSLSDGGVDGIIGEDKLGLDVIYIQAKRWASVRIVGRDVIDSFAGSMLRAGVSKGILIATSKFSSRAFDLVNEFRQQTCPICRRRILVTCEEFWQGEIETYRLHENRTRRKLCRQGIHFIRIYEDDPQRKYWDRWLKRLPCSAV